MEKITITGASGFVGRYLSRVLIDLGFNVTGIGTSARHPLEKQVTGFRWISADTSKPGDWQNHVRDSDAIINLTGRNIFSYWSKAYKQSIYDSRILTTRNIVHALDEEKKQILINASAVGIYGDRGEAQLDEASSAGNDFLAQVCVDWEKEALKARDKESDVFVMRFGVVLGEGGGALEKMLPAFRMFAGGPLGGGRHWFPWIHIKDLANAVIKMIDGEIEPGIYNFTSVEPIRQADFAKTLGKTLGRPSFMPAPAFMIRLIMGELGRSLLHSQKAIPKGLREQGFKFEFPDAASALRGILIK